MMQKFSKRNRSISNTKMFSATMAWQLQCVLLVLLCAAESTYSVCTSLLKNNGNVTFTASSSSVGPGYPVLHGQDVWCAKFINGEQFLKVDLGSIFTFDQVFVQGMPGTHRSVFKYYVKTSITRRGFVQIEGEGGQKVFFGPYCDGDAVVGTNLTNPVQARWIVFNPQKPFFRNSPCMRIDIRSCQNTPPATSSTVQPTCNSRRPVNGVPMSWGAWSACSETCGNGTRSRKRECTTPIPAGSEEACYGGEICTETCFIRHCPIPGNWSTWSDWSSCSETCGYGTRVRTRSCNNPAPAHGGATCQGDAINTDACFVRPCPTTSPPTTTLPQTTPLPSETTKPPSTTGSPDTTTSSVQTTATPATSSTVPPTCNSLRPAVNGVWKSWGAWSACSETCGNGTRSRKRECTTPIPAGSEEACYGGEICTETCFIRHCPMSGNWSTWSDWSSCSETCGYGTRVRTRSCNNPAPAYGGATCQGDAINTDACFVRPCPTTSPPTTTLPQTTPSPSETTKPPSTTGSPDTTTSSVQTTATSPPTTTLPQTTTSPSETTKAPSTTPSPDTTSLSVQTTATSPTTTTLPQTTTSPSETTKAPSTTPSPDTTSLSVQTTATSPPTTTLPKTTTSPPETTKPPSTTASPDTTTSSVQPTVAGNWSNWGAWSACSETCGNGTRNRTRLCNNPTPAHGGAACQGDANNTEACLVRYCPIAGNWSNWGAWSACSETCGNGTRNRTRLCNNPTPAHGGAACQGDANNTEACLVRYCPIAGNWSNWGAWSACSETCGNGTRNRTRLCNNPTPAHGGAACQGDANNTEACLVRYCPIAGNWSNWGAWSACSETCGNGTRNRTRLCNNPTPAHGGAACQGDANNTEACLVRYCPIAGNWSNWGAWSACSETCGNGTRNRTRLCNNPTPAHGGAACQGDANNTEACLVRYCPIAGNWSNWGAWSACSETCGNGTRNRTRSCNKPAPAHGGSPCKGDPNSIEACFVRHCPTTSPPTTILPQTTTSPPQTTKPPGTTASPDTTTSPVQPTGINRTYIDIVFTLIASSEFSNETYALMETTAKQFIEEYEYVNYYVIAYVDGVLKMVNLSFGANESNAAARRARRAVDASEPLINVLEEALVAFQNNSLGESNNRKALVVMTDISSSADKNSLEKAVRPIEESGILVISVPIGAVNRTELLVISPNPLDVISVDKNLQPLQLANRIGERIIRKIPEIDVGFAISVSSIESTVIYAVMVQASSTINERYRDFRVRFNIIVYGTKKTTRLSEFFNTLLSQKDLITSVRNLANVSSLPLQEKLREAENLFRSTGRPFARRVFVPITDAGNGSEIITGSNILRSHGIVFLSLNKNVDQLSSVTISHVDNLGTPSPTTDRRVVIAEEIIYQALRANWSPWGPWSACSETCGNGTRSRTRLCINPAPPQGGAPCKGDANNIEACLVRKCPELDVTFALSATSVQSQKTFVLMRGTIISIINRYGIDRIHYSAIVFGSGIPTTSFDFASNIPDQDELIRKVIRLRKRGGRPDLEQALEEAKRIFELREVRPNARRILVVIMDDATVSSREELNKVVHSLVKNSVFIVGVGIGSSVNATDLLIITRQEQHILIVKTNKVGDELAEEIMTVIDPRVAPAGFSLWGKWSECSKTCSSLNQTGTQRRNRTCINVQLGCEGSINETRECNNQTCQAIGPVVSPAALTGETGKGILIALFVMAGILTSLLLIFCCYYCCWHVCCGRGKKRKGITHNFLVEDEESERWVFVPTELTSGQNRGHENEVQEVVVEIGEEAGKPTGVIQFGIVADQSMENEVTADSVHPEPPLYSEEVAQVNSNASTLKMENPEPRYANLNVVRTKPKNDQKGFFKIRRKLGSRLSNGRHESSPEWLSDPFENSTDNDSVNSFRCLDDFAIVDYEMFEGRRGSDQSADTVPDGYTRMQETNREFVNMNNAVDTNESPATQNDSNQFGEKEEPVAESGDQSMEVLEEWFNPTGKDAQPTQSSDRIDPVYSEVGTQIPTAEPINTEVESHSIYSVVGSKISS